MPHINSIRLSNVYFNNATQFYEDFNMQLSGKNTTYDLENGGGKSLLLQMILQTVLPKTNLRREKPISLLFQGGRDRTSHVAVDWILDDGSQYKYLLTGFCARKRKGTIDVSKDLNEEEDNLQSGDIDNLNWCIFHNDSSITDIRTIPFVKEEGTRKIYAGFEDIRRYIQQVKQKGLPAMIFDKIGEYQSYISNHNLISAEWNIIRGINSGENNIESYFRQNITSRKLIENQFVKIIEDVEALNRGEKTNQESLVLADTLIEIRGSLNEYLKLKSHMAEFERIKEYYDEFGKKNEELYKVIEEYENCKDQASAIRNLIIDTLSGLEKDKNIAINQVEDNMAAKNEGTTLKRQLEAGLVKYGIDRLSMQKERLDHEKETLTQKKKELDDKYSQAMVLEGYGEYRDIKLRLKENEHSLKIFEKDGNELNEQYRNAGGKLRFLVENKIKEVTICRNDLSEKRGALNNVKKEKEELLNTKKNSQVRLETQIESLNERENTLGNELKEVENYFLVRGEIEAISNPSTFLEKTQSDINESVGLYEKDFQRLKEIELQLQNLALNKERLNGEANLLKETKNRYEKWIDDYNDKLNSLNKKAVGLGKSNPQEYREELEGLIHAENLNKLKFEVEAGRLEQKQQLSEQRGYYVPNEEILLLANQLSEKCEYAQAGVDWIAELAEAEKELIIEQIPYLPFSVIVDRKSFERLKNNKIKVDFSSDYPVPVVNVETIRRKSNTTKEDIYYLCSFSGLILEKSRYKQYIEGIEVRIRSINNQIADSESRIDNLGADLLEVSTFFDNYSKNKVNEIYSKLKVNEKQTHDLVKNLDKIEKEKIRLSEERNSVTKHKDELSILIEDSRKKSVKLRNSIQLAYELDIIRKNLNKKQKELATINRYIKDIEIEIQTTVGSYEAVQIQINELNLELHDLEKENEPLISFSVIETGELLVEVRARYKSLSEAVSGNIASESKLRSEIEDLKGRLSRVNDKIIRDFGVNLKQIEEREKRGEQITIPSDDSIKKIKKDIKELDNKLKAVACELEKVSGKMFTAEGQLKEILKDLAEEGNDLPQYDSEERYEQEIQFTLQLIKSYEEEIKKHNLLLDKIKSKTERLSHQADYFDSFILREGVVDNGQKAKEIREFRTFEKDYLNLDKNLRLQSEKWSHRIKAINEETVTFVISDPIEELAKISRPVTTNQCLAMRDAFKEYIMNIEEQMQKINDDLVQLENYQQDFTRRCVQRAEFVLSQLKKLESLSRIDVFGRRKNMIELRLTELEEKEKYLRMKNHIDTIVKEISEIGSVDRKFVAAKLSTKVLLAQITDMDKAAVRLYKVESIPENSRYYRWERAIGSEGQNNSLYFIFAACLISFIRMLSVTNTFVKTKKVIIADNPFGATSAVYLWDPMFKIMKQNDIQLIAPGHRIPREITSRFGVSYLLNQEILDDGKIRVVVKDVRAEEDEDVLKFIEPEQMTLM